MRHRPFSHAARSVLGGVALVVAAISPAVVSSVATRTTGVTGTTGVHRTTGCVSWHRGTSERRNRHRGDWRHPWLSTVHCTHPLAVHAADRRDREGRGDRGSTGVTGVDREFRASPGRRDCPGTTGITGVSGTTGR